jgi:type II secretory pathway pseudopilin PulG
MDVAQSPGRGTWLRPLAVAILAVPLGIFVLGVLATMIAPSVIYRIERSSGGMVRADLTAIDAALKVYAINNDGAYPDDLGVLVTPDENGYTYFDRAQLPLDPWMRPYRY